MLKPETLPIALDTKPTWEKVNGRTPVFLDTSCWVRLREGRTATASRVRDQLTSLVEAGTIFCPLSWGLLEELFRQEPNSRDETATLMEILSLNVTYVNRADLFRWEVDRSVRQALGEESRSLEGLYAPVFGFIGLHLEIGLSGVDSTASPKGRLQEKIQEGLGTLGVREIASYGSASTVAPPKYSRAAEAAAKRFKGNKRALFTEEAANIFRLHVIPALHRFPLGAIRKWLEYCGVHDDWRSFFEESLKCLPALYNHCELMVVAASDPSRMDKPNDFFDSDIMMAPLAYAAAFAAKDSGVRHILEQQTSMLERTQCRYCADLDELEDWLSTELSERQPAGSAPNNRVERSG